jgi:hypothetical protein
MIPEGMSSQLHVHDMVNNQRSTEWAKAAVWELPTNTAGNIRPMEALLEQWIKTAWNHSSLASAIQVFSKCCMSNDKNRTEGDILWD